MRDLLLSGLNGLGLLGAAMLGATGLGFAAVTGGMLALRLLGQ